MKRICFLQAAFAALLVPSAMFAQKVAEAAELSGAQRNAEERVGAIGRRQPR